MFSNVFFLKREWERNRLPNKVPVYTALLKEGGNLHSLTKTGAGELLICSAVSHLSQEAGQEEAAYSGPQLDSASS